jgi:diguanylate cyclase (GGDEF)-like protein
LSLWPEERHSQVIAEHASGNSVRTKPPPDDGCRRGASVDRGDAEARLSEQLEGARRLHEDFVLVLLDLDEFGQLNDAHGRRKGDDALALVAQVLRSSARPRDSVAYRGDDEFVVLMPGASLVGARDFFERTRAEIVRRSRILLGFKVRLSAGAVKFLNDPGDTQDLLETAYYAMYLAKRQGKDRLFTTVAVRPDEAEAKPGA